MDTASTPDDRPARRTTDPLEVCTLSADGMQERLAWIHHEILPHHVATERLVDGLALELAPAPGLRERLERLIALERACCDGIVFALAPAGSPDGLRLEIRGVDPDAPVLAALRRPAASRSDRGRRLARAAGVGAALGLLLCCAAPVAAVLLVGATPWRALDHPGTLALVSAAGTGAAWWWLAGRRRRGGPRRDASRDGCGGGC
ncbi:MAG: hypothetical protein R3263_01730 [Myxococcota bacterium]|nr:hypothetical protein [Myxococcota bacterium]